MTDATASLTPHKAREAGITVVPVPIQMGRVTFLDGEDPPERFYNLLAGGALPQTSTPSPGTFVEVYRRLAEQAEAIVSVHVTGRKSAMCQAARIAAEMLPDLEVHVVDSGQVSLGLGLLAEAAAQQATLGRAAVEIARWLEQAVARTHVFAAIRELNLLRRSGRVSLGKALLAGLLDIKPILQVHAGAVEVVDQVRAWPRAVERMLDRVRESISGGTGSLRLAVAHTHCAADAEALRARVRDEFPGIDIRLADAGPALASHAGPGALAICLLREPGE